MSVQITGTVEYQDIGVGVWALVSEGGETYELSNPPMQLQQPGLKCTVEGTVKEGSMSIAMIGPILEVNSFSPNG